MNQFCDPLELRKVSFKNTAQELESHVFCERTKNTKIILSAKLGDFFPKIAKTFIHTALVLLVVVVVVIQVALLLAFCSLWNDLSKFKYSNFAMLSFCFHNESIMWWYIVPTIFRSL